MSFIRPIMFACLLAGCGQLESRREFNAQQGKCQEAISHWIATHAMYPASYQPISFDEFSVGRTLQGDRPVPNSETYALRHTHRLRNIHGDTATFTGYFLLDHRFEVGMIETSRSNTISVGSDPDWKAWTDLFARPLTAADTAAFKRRPH